MNEQEGPSLVDTGRGLTVAYKERFLYSSRDPARTPELAASRATILPETLILCPSPVLAHGLTVLISRLPARCAIIGVFCDEALYSLALAQFPPSILGDPRLALVFASTPADVARAVERLALYPFRRCLRLDLSGASSIWPDFFARAVSAIDSVITAYWKNRVVLMRLGRGFALNIFENLGRMSQGTGRHRVKALIPHSIRRTVFVAGAGPSLDESLGFLRANADSLFILAVDTALPALRAASIRCDAVIVLESQYWIERACIGFAGSNIPVLADLTARPGAVWSLGGPVAFFHTPYTQAAFLDRLAGSEFPALRVPPLGSVGLAAIHVARALSSGGPILVSGLDFSWGTGYTHSRGALASLSDRGDSDRLNPVGMASASFAEGSTRVPGKGDAIVTTNPALASYSSLCKDAFGNEHSIFDLGLTGLPTGLIPIAFDEAVRMIAENAGGESQRSIFSELGEGVESRIERFLDEERNALSTLRSVLTGEDSGVDDRNAVGVNDKGALTPARALRETADSRDAIALIRELDYLYLHFPDAHACPNRTQGFLNRARVETERFLKELTIGRRVSSLSS